MITKRAIYIIFWLSQCSFFAKAQVYCPPNIGFELNNFTYWTLYTGICCPISVSSSGAVNGRHTITTGTATDPYGGFPVVAPASGQKSLKLGNSSTGSQAERARYYIRVPQDANNYSLIMRYAVVFQDGGHTAAEQPRFDVSAVDSVTNQPINCAQFSFVANSSLPGFTYTSNDVWYKSWSTISIDLSGRAGRTIRIDFSSGDCNQGGHFGYGYIDLDCGLFQVGSTVCRGTATSNLTAPPGFASYRWYDSTFTTLLGSSQNLTVPTPISFNKYYVILSPFAGYGCPDTLSTQIKVSDIDVSLGNDTTLCSGYPMPIFKSVTSDSAFRPVSYSWSPSSALSCTTCPDPLVNTIGTQQIILSVTDATGCSDRDTVVVKTKPCFDLQPTSKQVCAGQPGSLVVKVFGPLSYNYQWYKNGVPVASQTNDTLSYAAVYASDTGRYKVLATNLVDTVFSNEASLTFFPGDSLQIQEQPLPVLQCRQSNAVFRIKATAIRPINYQWKKNGVNIAGATADSLYIPQIKDSDTGEYSVLVRSWCDTILSNPVRLRLKLPTSIKLQPAAITVCKQHSALFFSKGEGADSVKYKWTKNGVLLAGEQSDTLRIPQVIAADTGLYRVIVEGGCGLVVSAPAGLGVFPSPKITDQPDGINLCKDSSVVFKVSASGQGTPLYRWYKNNTAVYESNADSLVIPNAGISDTGAYKVFFISQCDSIMSDEVLLTYHPAIPSNLPDSILLCPSSDSTISISGYQSYLWNTGENTPLIKIKTSGIYSVIYTNNYGCAAKDSALVTLGVLPSVFAGRDTALCNERVLQLSASASDIKGSQWLHTPAGFFDDSSMLVTSFNVNEGLTTGEQLIIQGYNLCGTATDTLTVTFTSKPDPSFLLSDTLVCVNDSAVILTPAQNGGLFGGSHIENNTRFNPVEAGLFKVKHIITLNACIDSSEKQIEVLEVPVANFTYTPEIPDINQKVLFKAENENALNHYWIFSLTDFREQDTTSMMYDMQGKYRVRMVAQNRICFDTTEKEVLVRTINKIWVPSAFTPNDDGLNDVFKLSYINIRSARTEIYNRWGQLVFVTNNIDEGWDGTFEGNPCTVDVYVYVIKYIDFNGRGLEKSGYVTLLR